MLVKVFPDYIYNKHKKKSKKITKTKEIANSKYKKFLDKNYYNKNYSKLSDRQKKKVREYIKENI